MSKFGCEECEYENNCPAFSHTGRMESTGICPFKKEKAYKPF